MDFDKCKEKYFVIVEGDVNNNFACAVVNRSRPKLNSISSMAARISASAFLPTVTAGCPKDIDFLSAAVF